MAIQPVQPGCAPANPSSLVDQFLAVGGRIMLNPSGRLEIAGGLNRILSGSDSDAHRAYIAAQAIVEAARSISGSARLIRIVRANGVPTNGWLVMEGR